MTPEEAFETYINGNITIAKGWLKICNKRGLLAFIAAAPEEQRWDIFQMVQSVINEPASKRRMKR